MNQIVSVGTSNDDDMLKPYGVTEAEVAMFALDAIHYAHDKAEGNRPRFLFELVGEFEAALREAMDLPMPDD